jgi:hypothetical protein
VPAQDVALRSTQARWLMPAGYTGQLAGGERRAREVLADGRLAPTILAPDRLVAPLFALDLVERIGKWIVVSG